MLPGPAPAPSLPPGKGFAPIARLLALVTPRLLLMAVSAAAVLGFALSPWLQRNLGISDSDRWFLDSYAVLAATDAMRAGINTSVGNPLDVFGRPHRYSDWWYGLNHMGLSRSDNFVVGATWVLMFLVVVWLTSRPRDLREAASSALLLLSPPVLLGIVRANNDLVVFALLGVAAVALRAPSAPRSGIAIAAVAVAEGLKFYPVVAGFVFLLLRPMRRMLWVSAVAMAVLVAVLANVWSTIARGVFDVPPSLYTFGSPVLLRDLGWTGGGALLAGFVIIGAAAVWLVGRGRTSGLGDATRPLERRILFGLGAVTLLACFLAGTSYAYRWIFGLWLAPWLWDEARDSGRPAPIRRLAQRTVTLLAALMWADGLFCLVVNVAAGPMSEASSERLQLIWRLVTQPLAWILMALLAGWLLDAALATAREFGGAARPADPGSPPT